MSTRLVRSLAALSLGAATWAATWAVQAQEINFGIIATDAANVQRERWEPFFRDMEKKTGLTVKSFYAPDYAGVIEAMRFNKVQVAWYGNKAAMEAVDRANGEIFAQVRFMDGSYGYHSLLITHVDSPYKTLDDVFKNAKSINFGIGDPNSTSGFLVPTFYIFARNGIDHRTAFKTIRSASHGANIQAALAKQVDVVTNNQIDLLHVHYAIPHAAAAYMAKQILAKAGKKIPVITTLHGTDITLVGRDKTYSPVVTFSMNESDVLTAVSHNLKAETYANFAVDRDIEVIHNFVDVNRFNKKPVDAFKKLIAPNGERIIVHASNFRKVKRVGDVIHTFLLVSQKVPSKLLLLGDGPERPYAESICRDCVSANDIRFLGKQEQMEDILPVADLFLLTSEYESFGLAALEAMAASVPVISTNAGGLPEIMEDGVCGYMSPVGDVEDMCAQAMKIFRDDETLKRFKENALKQALKFDSDTIVPLYEALYRKFAN